MSYLAGELTDEEHYQQELERRKKRDEKRKKEMLEWGEAYREQEKVRGHPWRRAQSAKAGRTKKKSS